MSGILSGIRQGEAIMSGFPDMRQRKAIGMTGFLQHIGLGLQGEVYEAHGDSTLQAISNRYLEDAVVYEFDVGEEARFKDLNAKQAKKLQNESNLKWIPLITEMKGRFCKVKEVHSSYVCVETEDRYVLNVNPKLLKPVDTHPHGRCFDAGDKVRMKPLCDENISDYQQQSGIPYNDDILKAKNLKGTVDSVEDGRVFSVTLETGLKIICCRAILQDDKVREPQSDDERQTSGRKRHSSKSYRYRPRDEVTVRDLPVAEMKILQSNHGGWDPYMKMARGKTGTVKNVTTDGNLNVEMKDSHLRWYFNRECVTLSKKATSWKVGDRVRVIDIPRITPPVPVMEKLKHQEGVVKFVFPQRQVRIQTLDGYLWVLSPDLLEELDKEGSPEIRKHIKKGDKVTIQDLPDMQIKQLQEDHGLKNDEMLEVILKEKEKQVKVTKEKKKKAKVTKVQLGGIVEVQLANKTKVKCCLPILHQESAATESNEEFEEIDLTDLMSVFQASQLPVPDVDPDHCSPIDLHLAAHDGNIPLTEQILRGQPDWINHMTDDGENTILMDACGSENEDLVKFLVEKGAKVDVENVFGATAAMTAVLNENNEIVKYLLSQGAQVTKTQASVLDAAVRGGSKECLDTVLAECTLKDVQWQDSKKDTNPFCAAVIRQNKYALEQLLTKDPDGISRATQYGKITLLHVAALTGSVDLIEFILSQKGHNVDAKDLKGSTPVAIATAAGDLGAVKCLIDNGAADLTLKDNDGRSCLHILCLRLSQLCMLEQMPFIGQKLNEDIKVCLEISSILLKSGCTVDDLDYNGETPTAFLQDSNLKAAILAQAEEVFKTTFIIDIKGGEMESVRNQTLASLLPSFTQESAVEEYLPHQAKATGDILEHLSQVHINSYVLNECQELKQVCDVFASHGAIITSVAKGSVHLEAVITSESQLEKVKKAYENGELQKQVSESMIAKEKAQRSCAMPVDIQWNPEEIQRGREYFKHASPNVSKESKEIDHRGGTIDVEGTGVSLKIPAGALPEGKKEKLTVSVLWQGEHAPLKDGQHVIAPQVLLEPEGTQFHKQVPVILTVPYFATDLSPEDVEVWLKQGWNEEWACFLNGEDDTSQRSFQVTSSHVNIRLNHFSRIEPRAKVKKAKKFFTDLFRASDGKQYMHTYMKEISSSEVFLKIETNFNKKNKGDHNGYSVCAEACDVPVALDRDFLIDASLIRPETGRVHEPRRHIRISSLRRGNSQTDMMVSDNANKSSGTWKSNILGYVKGGVEDSNEETGFRSDFKTQYFGSSVMVPPGRPNTSKPMMQESVCVEMDVDLNRAEQTPDIIWNIVGIRNYGKKGKLTINDVTEGDDIKEKPVMMSTLLKMKDVDGSGLIDGQDFRMDPGLGKMEQANIEVFENPKPVLILDKAIAYRRNGRVNNKIMSTQHVIDCLNKQAYSEKVSCPNKQCFIYKDKLPCSEGPHHEFKLFDGKDIENQIVKEIATYVSAFANFEGGIIFFGVNDDGRVLGFLHGKNFEGLNERVLGVIKSMLWLQEEDGRYVEVAESTKFIECCEREVKVDARADALINKKSYSGPGHKGGGKRHGKGDAKQAHGSEQGDAKQAHQSEQGDAKQAHQSEQGDAKQAHQSEQGGAKQAHQSEQGDAKQAHQSEQGDVKQAHQSEQGDAKQAHQSEQGDAKQAHQSEQGDAKQAHQSEQGDAKQAHQSEQGNTKQAHQSEQGDAKQAHQSEQGDAKQAHQSEQGDAKQAHQSEHGDAKQAHQSEQGDAKQAHQSEQGDTKQAHCSEQGGTRRKDNSSQDGQRGGQRYVYCVKVNQLSKGLVLKSKELPKCPLYKPSKKKCDQVTFEEWCSLLWKAKGCVIPR